MKNIIVAFGDSLIKGNPIPDTGGWVQRVFDKLGERENFILINKGGGGDNTLNLLERIDLDCLSHKPSGVILGVGVNDSRIRDSKNMASEVSIEQYKANLEKIISILRNESISLCLFAPLPVVDSLSDPFKPDKRYQLKWVQLYHNTFVEIGKKYNYPIVDVFDELKSLSETELVEILPDGVHPSPQGYELISKRAEPTIRNWLSSI